MGANEDVDQDETNYAYDRLDMDYDYDAEDGFKYNKLVAVILPYSSKWHLSLGCSF